MKKEMETKNQLNPDWEELNEKLKKKNIMHSVGTQKNL